MADWNLNANDPKEPALIDYLKLKINEPDTNVDPWQPDTDYTVRTLVTQNRLSDGQLTIFSWSDAVNNADVETDGTSGSTWNAAEEARWEQVGEAPINVEVLQCIEVTVRGYFSSFTSAGNLVLIDAQGSDYDSDDWSIISDDAVANANPPGTALTGAVFSPPVNNFRTIGLRYTGGSTRRGLSAIRINLRAGVPTTGVTTIRAKYFSGASNTWNNWGAEQDEFIYVLPELFDFVTDPQLESSELPVPADPADNGRTIEARDGAWIVTDRLTLASFKSDHNPTASAVPTGVTQAGDWFTVSADVLAADTFLGVDMKIGGVLMAKSATPAPDATGWAYTERQDLPATITAAEITATNPPDGPRLSNPKEIADAINALDRDRAMVFSGGSTISVSGLVGSGAGDQDGIYGIIPEGVTQTIQLSQFSNVLFRFVRSMGGTVEDVYDSVTDNGTSTDAVVTGPALVFYTRDGSGEHLTVQKTSAETSGLPLNRARMTGAASSLGNATASVMALDTVVREVGSGANLANNQYTIPINGWYQAAATLSGTSSAADFVLVGLIRQNANALTTDNAEVSAGTGYSISLSSGAFYATAGDTIDVQGAAFSTGSENASTIFSVTQLSDKSSSPSDAAGPRVFAGIDETDSETFTDGEIIFVQGSSQDDLGVAYAFFSGATDGDYEINDASSGYLNRMSGNITTVELEPDGGADEPVSFSFGDDNFGDFDNDMNPTFRIYFIKRNAASTAIQSYQSGSTIIKAVAADDFEWHAFRRISQNAVSYMGQITGSGESLADDDVWTDWGNADGVMTTGRKVVKAETIILPDSANSTLAPVHNTRMSVTTPGNMTWAEWATAGGLFETEGNGPTTLNDPNSVAGDSSDTLVWQYDLVSDSWSAKFGSDVNVAGTGTPDTAASGYQDIPGTNLREQWGVEADAGVTFPAPFKAGTTPTVIPVALSAGDNQNITLQSVDHLGFTTWIVRNESDVGIAAPTMHWIAKGEKP